MRYVFGLLMVILCAGSVLATADPGSDQIGVYFDTNADEVCLEINHMMPFTVYVVITNPSSAEVLGAEFRFGCFDADGSDDLILHLSDTWAAPCPKPIDLVYQDYWLDGAYINCTSPVPQVGANVVLMEATYMILAPLLADFYLGPPLVQSILDGLPAYIGEGGEILPLGISSGDPGLPVASINGDCRVVPDSPTTFSRLKCLYR